MESLRLAVPSNSPGGLEAQRSDHFGHCDIFTLVDIKDSDIVAVKEVSNIEHGPGGCMAPVTMLSDHKVDVIVVGGIGARPLQGFNDAGISVYLANRDSVQDVRTVAEGIIDKRFPLIHPDQACKNSGNCHH